MEKTKKDKDDGIYTMIGWIALVILILTSVLGIFEVSNAVRIVCLCLMVYCFFGKELFKKKKKRVVI